MDEEEIGELCKICIRFGLSELPSNTVHAQSYNSLGLY